jgi:hypothetical protein
VELVRAGGKTESHTVLFGEEKLIPLELGEEARAKISPAKGFDAGEGGGKNVERTVHGGVVGLILDGRGRPIALDPSDPARVEKIRTWTGALQAYPSLEPALVG